MAISRLLIANRGEIAIRIAQAAADLGITSVAVYADDDAASLHTWRADEAHPLAGSGARAYLDIEGLVRVAKEAGCDAVHPGYGFLSENAEFARQVEAAGLTWVGPAPETLDMFGDKAEARSLATAAGVPVLPGSDGPVDLEGARAFMESLGAPIMLKAVAGGGGRGVRAVREPDELERALARCESEAKAAFGNGAIYAERYIPRARHIEVQVIGDKNGVVSHAWERDCSVQRRNQKIVEIAPSPGLSPELRQRILESAVLMARQARYRNLGTFEFLVDDTEGAPEPGFFFIEANARLQVEHTVTEEVTGLDLVQTQLHIANGERLGDLRLEQAMVPPPRGYAIQARVNMEAMRDNGQVVPSGGHIAAFEPPAGPGIRVDSFGYAGYQTSTNYDSLLAKVIVHSPTRDFGAAARKLHRALGEFRIDGFDTNIPFLRAVAAHEAFVSGDVYTAFVDEQWGALVELAREAKPRVPAAASPPGEAPAEAPPVEQRQGRAGSRVDSGDPLAVLEHGKQQEVAATAAKGDEGLQEGEVAVRAPLQGTIVSIDVTQGDAVARGQQVLVMEAMKMEHVITAEASGRVRNIAVEAGDAVYADSLLVTIEAGDVDVSEVAQDTVLDLDYIRPDLEEVFQRHRYGLDQYRPDAVEKRHSKGQRTARENIDDLCDPGTFIEYGPLVVAPQRRRRTEQDLIEKTPADGMVAGIGSVNGDRFDDRHSRCVLMSYDYTVLAGTQGGMNHRKKDRMFEIAEKERLPIVFFTEGGGGRPGDTDGTGVAGLDTMAFNYYAKLSGLVPLVGITTGRCFAGNAALLGCCDVVIATEGSNIGMGGPAMIEGGGLGVFRPEDVGPMDVQRANGVVDIAVKDEAEAVDAARQYLSYFQGPVDDWSCADQRRLRHAIHENRLRVYEVRQVIDLLADAGSVLELRRDFGHGMVTALARVEGRPLGIIANNPEHLAGAIDSEAADKAARFMQLCDAHDIPILTLCDTPGIMVGPEVEKTALVRHASRMFVTGANLTVPVCTIVLRKGYGLGAQAMAGGSFKAPLFCVSWPTGEFGGMGLEGAVKLGYRNELAAIEDPEERRKHYEEMVERMYERGKAVNMASHFEIDEVIDPAESRYWISRALRSAAEPEPRTGKKRPSIDTW